MDIGIDFGITNTDLVIENNGTSTFHTFASKDTIDTRLLDIIFSKLNLTDLEIENIAVTGGKSSNLPESYNSIPITKVNEVFAIGKGAKAIYNIQEDSFVVVSTGTGTACVSYINGEFHHLGGISFGGGTLQGLSNLLVDTKDSKKIDSMAFDGDKNSLDMLIGEVVNDIGSLDPDITASNFSKARDLKKFADEDIAASLMNMTGEVIGTIAYLNALLVGVDKVYFVGRVSLLESVTSAIDKRLELAGVTSVYIENREFANAIGSLSFLKPDR